MAAERLCLTGGPQEKFARLLQGKRTKNPHRPLVPQQRRLFFLCLNNGGEIRIMENHFSITVQPVLWSWLCSLLQCLSVHYHMAQTQSFFPFLSFLFSPPIPLDIHPWIEYPHQPRHGKGGREVNCQQPLRKTILKAFESTSVFLICFLCSPFHPK